MIKLAQHLCFAWLRFLTRVRPVGTSVAIFMLLSGLVTFPGKAAAQAPEAEQGALSVTKPRLSGRLVAGAMLVPPFVSRGEDGTWTGLSIELWQQVAAELGTAVEYRNYDYDPDGLLGAVQRREIDVAVGAIPLTPDGEQRFDFTHPYLTSGLGIAVRIEAQRDIYSTLYSYLTPSLFLPIGGLLGLLVTVGTLVWYVERKRNPAQFSPRLLPGIGDGMWWAAVTMTTTGYGDKTPVTTPGRALGLLWMYVSIFCIAAFSATLASSFVVNKLKTSVSGPEDLPTAKVAIVRGSAGEQWARLSGINAKVYPFAIQASKALQRGDVDALVFDKSLMGHMFKDARWSDLQILSPTLATQHFAFALPADSAIKEDVNRAILKISQKREWTELVQRHIGGR